MPNTFPGELKIFATGNGKVLTEKICGILLMEPGRALVDRFSDGEVRIEIEEDVRGKDCVIVGPTNPPAENFFEMMLLSRALKSSSAGRITLAPTYLGYSRQDRKDKPRVPISATIINGMLATCTSADRILLLDVHSEATLGVFDHCGIKVDHLYASVVSIPYLKTILTENFVFASPDKNGGARARAYAKRLGQEGYILFDKARTGPGRIDVKTIMIIGDIRGKDVLFIDDMIDTGGTIIADAKAGRQAGANRIIIFATHALLSQGAIGRLEESEVDEAIFTDTIYHPPEELKTARLKITTISVSNLLASAIKNIHEERSVSSLIISS
jgi:ribose-phosphate pyrophosphokinase